MPDIRPVQPDDDDDPLQLPDATVAELKQLSSRVPSVPAALDEAILRSAHHAIESLRPTRGRSERDQNGRKFSYWPVAASLMTAAAVCLCAMVSWRDGSQSSEQFAATNGSGSIAEDAQALLDGDIDGNGTLDILDAYTVARDVKSGAGSLVADMNRDGRLDDADVTLIAQRAVKL